MYTHLVLSAWIVLAIAPFCTDQNEPSLQHDLVGALAYDAPKIQCQVPHRETSHELPQLRNHYTVGCTIIITNDFLFLYSNLKRFPCKCYHRRHRITLLYLRILLVSRSSDIESNPGPEVSQGVQDDTRYPCGYCHEEVTWSNVMSIMCDNCDQWFHADCQGIGNTTFDILSQSKAVWYCNQCNFPNYTHGLFESLDTLSDTSAYADTNSISHLSHNISSPATSNLGSPQASSSPKAPIQPKPKPPKPKQPPKRLTIINVNCRSVVDKKIELKHLSDQIRPDIIAGTESWLKDTHLNSEIFDTDTYSIFRKDRKNKKGGEVFLAIKHCLNPVGQPDLDSESEIVWAKIDIPGLKDVYVCSFYKPIVNDLHSIDGLIDSLSKIPRTSHIWELGDFNLPHIDWESEQITQTCSCRSVYETFF